MVLSYVTSQAWDNDDTDDLAAAYYGTRTLVGSVVQSGSDWIGKSISTFECKIGITGSPTGTILGQIFANQTGSPGSSITSTNSYELDSLSAGDILTFEFSEGTIAEGSTICIQITESGTTASNYINLQGKAGLTAYPYIKQGLYGSSWETGTETPNCRMGYSDEPPPSSGGGRLPPPPLIARF